MCHGTGRERERNSLGPGGSGKARRVVSKKRRNTAYEGLRLKFRSANQTRKSKRQVTRLSMRSTREVSPANQGETTVSIKKRHSNLFRKTEALTNHNETMPKLERKQYPREQPFLDGARGGGQNGGGGEVDEL